MPPLPYSKLDYWICFIIKKNTNKKNIKTRFTQKAKQRHFNRNSLALFPNKAKMSTKNPPITILGRLAILLLLGTSCQAPTSILTAERQDLPLLTKTIINGQQVNVFPVVEGMMNLYFRMIPISEANLYNPYFPYNEPAEVPQFFVGKSELIRIDEWNYERVIKQLMQDRPALIKKLGRQGFRFENLKQMVSYYNKEQTKKSVLVQR